MRVLGLEFVGGWGLDVVAVLREIGFVGYWGWSVGARCSSCGLSL